MTRTEHVDVPRPEHKERGWARRLLMRRERVEVRELLSHEKYDEVDGRLTKGTEGWLSG